MSSSQTGADLRRRTKVVCTLGPASADEETLEQMIRAGMNVARLNFAHGNPENHTQLCRRAREVAGRLGQPMAIMQDLPGPKPRTGPLTTPGAQLQAGAPFTLTTEEVPGDQHRVSVNLPTLPQDIRPGDTIVLGDGGLRLAVETSEGSEVRCRVTAGGALSSDLGLHVPGVTLSIPSITERDLEHLAFGLELGVDFVALSYIRSAADVLRVRDFLGSRGARMPLVAKIERHQALADLEAILEAADGVMVARGDLGLEIPIEKVPVAQKQIVARSNRLGKPVIVATQMLESMISSPSPTRAEVADVANAIFDGADAVMLSAETAIGRYPVEAVAMMARVAMEAEAALPHELILRERALDLVPQTDDAISYDACHTAQQLGAAAIVAFTSSGSTALRVARCRPRVPVLALTPSEATRRWLALSWGVYAFPVVEPATVDELFSLGARLALETGAARRGDLVVITAGTPIGEPGTTNLLKVERV